MLTPPAAQIEAFYRAALAGLRFMDQQSKATRFGPAADARWKSFQGHLGTSDRMDLVCRDAAIRWKAAFSPSLVFGLRGLAEDEPFGPDWPGVEEPLAAKVWQAAQALPLPNEAAAIGEAAMLLGCKRVAVTGNLAKLTAGSRLAVGGLSAIAAAAEAFVGRGDLRWAEQVTVVADAPAERQLAGLVAPVLQATGPTRVVGPESGAIAQATAQIVSLDTSEAVRAVFGKQCPSGERA